MSENIIIQKTEHIEIVVQSGLRVRRKRCGVWKTGTVVLVRPYVFPGSHGYGILWDGENIVTKPEEISFWNTVEVVE